MDKQILLGVFRGTTGVLITVEEGVGTFIVTTEIHDRKRVHSMNEAALLSFLKDTRSKREVKA